MLAQQPFQPYQFHLLLFLFFYEKVFYYKEKITLYDFIKISHICKEGRAYLEVVTSIKTYLFPSQLTAISEVKINED